MARVPKVAHGKISFARGIHRCPNVFLFLLPDQRLYAVWYVCMCMCVCVYTHICVKTVYELLLLPNNTANARFLHQSGAVRSADWIFTVGVPAGRWLDEYVIMDRMFYSLLLKRLVAAHSYGHSLFRIAFLEEALIINLIIISLINHIIIITEYLIIIMEDAKTSFCSSKFSRARWRISSKFIANVGTRPQKGSPAPH